MFKSISEAVVDILSSRKPGVWTVMGWTLFGICSLVYFACWICLQVGHMLLGRD